MTGCLSTEIENVPDEKKSGSMNTLRLLQDRFTKVMQDRDDLLRDEGAAEKRDRILQILKDPELMEKIAGDIHEKCVHSICEYLVANLIEV
jgi:phosphodiesterase/alkaline phosphatase D-like protein